MEKPSFSFTEDLLECLGTKELSAVTEDPAYYSFGLVSGLARKTYCLAAVTEKYLALSLTPQLAEQLLSPFETVRPGREVFFHNMKSPWPHWLDQDIRRLRLHFLPKNAFGKVAMFNRVPFGSISLRDCTAKGEGFTIMWQLSTLYCANKQNDEPI